MSHPCHQFSIFLFTQIFYQILVGQPCGEEIKGLTHGGVDLGIRLFIPHTF